MEVQPPPACVLAPGDSAKATAAVVSGGFIIYSIEYESTNRPRAFRWSSGDTGVVWLTPEGIVVGRRPGSALVRATADGMAGDATMVVAEPFAVVSVVPQRAVLTVGDTILVRFEGADSVAASLPSPHLSAPYSRVVTTTFDDSAHLPGIVAVAPGNAIVTWCAAGRSGLLRVVVDP